MKRWVVLFGMGLVLFLSGSSAGAEEAVLNNPAKAVNLVKAIVDQLDFSYETVWALSDNTWSQGVSASLYNLSSNQIHLASLRVGYGTGEKFYGGVGLDLPGLTKRFVPTMIKGVMTTTPLDILWSVVGKYARITPVAGYNWNEDKPLYGVSLGAAVSF